MNEWTDEAIRAGVASVIFVVGLLLARALFKQGGEKDGGSSTRNASPLD